MPNYNNFNNYPYGMPYSNPYGVNSGYQSNYNQQMQQPQMQQQTSYLPLSFTNGVIGAKAFIVAPNQTVYLRDSDEGSNLLFEKSADMYGKYTIKAYRLSEVNIDDVGKPLPETPKKEYITKEDLNNFRLVFESKMNVLSSLIQNSVKPQSNEVASGEKDE